MVWLAGKRKGRSCIAGFSTLDIQIGRDGTKGRIRIAADPTFESMQASLGMQAMHDMTHSVDLSGFRIEGLMLP
eukprot:scaffold41097_cov18-Prasinocladus_malaysianus.AAC.1